MKKKYQNFKKKKKKNLILILIYVNEIISFIGQLIYEFTSIMKIIKNQTRFKTDAIINEITSYESISHLKNKMQSNMFDN